MGTERPKHHACLSDLSKKWFLYPKWNAQLMLSLSLIYILHPWWTILQNMWVATWLRALHTWTSSQSRQLAYRCGRRGLDCTMWTSCKAVVARPCGSQYTWFTLTSTAMPLKKYPAAWCLESQPEDDLSQQACTDMTMSQIGFIDRGAAAKGYN